jgi:hypothetical protein
VISLTFVKASDELDHPAVVTNDIRSLVDHAFAVFRVAIVPAPEAATND